MNVDGVLFDLDGTLWDSCRAVAESWNRSLERLTGTPGGFTAADTRSIMGLTEAQIAERLFARFGLEAAAFCRRCLLDEGPYLTTRGGELYPGVRELLEQLSRSVPLFIVSNCQAGYIEGFLAYTGLGPLFADTRCEGGTGRTKSENIRELCRAYGLQRPVYIGDTAMDQRSAAEAGCVFLHAAYGFGTAEAPLAAGSAAELAALLQAL